VLAGLFLGAVGAGFSYLAMRHGRSPIRSWWLRALATYLFTLLAMAFGFVLLLMLLMRTIENPSGLWVGPLTLFAPFGPVIGLWAERRLLGQPAPARVPPSGRLDPDRRVHVLIITAYRLGSSERVTLEVPYDQWWHLAPVRRVVDAELTRRKLPVHLDGDAPSSAWTGEIPSARIERRNGQDWVMLTAERYRTADIVTVEMTWEEWLNFPPLRWVTETEILLREEDQWIREELARGVARGHARMFAIHDSPWTRQRVGSRAAGWAN
jgi:hypothetical protein